MTDLLLILRRTQLCELLRNLKILAHLVKYPALGITQTFQ